MDKTLRPIKNYDSLKVIKIKTNKLVLIKNHVLVEFGKYEIELWKLINGERSSRELIDFISRKYHLRPSIVAVELDKFIKLLKNNNFIRFKKDEKSFNYKIYFAVFELTNRCNLKCKHCYLEFSRSVQSVSREDFIFTVGQFKKIGIKYVVLSGGEPLLYPRIFEAVRYLKKNSFKVILVTNGLLVKKIPLSFYKFLDLVQISLDGPEFIHDNIRGEGTFQKAFGAGNYLKKNGLKVIFMMTVHHMNKKFIKNLGRISHSVGIPLRFERMSGVGEGKKLRGLSPLEFKEVTETSKKIGIKSNDPLFNIYCIDSSRIKVQSKKQAGCSAGFSGIVVDPSLEVFPCVRLRISLGNLHHDTLSNIWKESPVLTILRDRSNLKDRCGTCKLQGVCGGCRAEAYAQTGDYLAGDPLCALKLMK